MNGRIMKCLMELQDVTQLNGPKIQECFNQLARELLTTEFRYNDLTFAIAELEFGCTKLNDDIHGNELQMKMGYVYVHKTKNNKFRGLKHLGIDLTCGSAQNWATLLIRAVKLNNEDIKGPSECLRAIIDYQEEAFEITPELKKKIELIDGKNFFDVFQETENKISPPIFIGKRVSIKNNGNNDYSLRATSLKTPDKKNTLTLI